MTFSTVRHPMRSTDGTRTAVVFAPALPVWDGGSFFRSITQRLLGSGYKVRLLDTVSAPECGSLSEMAEHWRAHLTQTESRVDLIAGNALGAAVAQLLMHDLDAPDGALFVSGPSRVDAALRDRLTEIVKLAEAGRDADALALLSYRVGAADQRGAPEPQAAIRRRRRGKHHRPELPAVTLAVVDARRVARGLRLLHDLDLTEINSAATHRIRHVVGAESQLVRAEHVVLGHRGDLTIIPGVGMRPQREAPGVVDQILVGLLES